MNIADMLRQLSPDQQAFFLQQLLMSGPRQNPPLGMGQYLPPQGMPSAVTRSIQTDPSVSDAQANNQPGNFAGWTWPQNYRGWEGDVRDAGQDWWRTPSGQLTQQLATTKQNEANNYPREEQNITGRYLPPPPNQLTRMPTGQYVPLPLSPDMMDLFSQLLQRGAGAQ
jgi:hypothetical protein